MSSGDGAKGASMTRVTFLLSKDPLTERGGDLDTTRVIMRLVADQFDVSAICLSSAKPGTSVVDLVPGGLLLTRVAKPPIVPRKLLARAVSSRRSLVHVRFDVDGLLPAIEAADAEIFVAEHSYMAEAFLRSSRFGSSGLVVNTINTESQVWRAAHGLVGRLEWRRIMRDELRVARGADAVGVYDHDEQAFYRSHGISSACWLDLTLPPTNQLDISVTPPRLVLLGRRDWPPNQEGFEEALRLWPEISTGIPGAELCVVGAKKPGVPDPDYPPGVRDLGFVDDLTPFLATCRALMAPIRTGGGVRVKILDAASRGMPVVATTPAIGSLSSLLQIPAFDTDAEFVTECRRYLLDRSAASKAGDHIYQANAGHWATGSTGSKVLGLLEAAAHV
jgi:polysaccharide biosynthesis protein PslH